MQTVLGTLDLLVWWWFLWRQNDFCYQRCNVLTFPMETDCTQNPTFQNCLTETKILEIKSHSEKCSWFFLLSWEKTTVVTGSWCGPWLCRQTPRSPTRRGSPLSWQHRDTGHGTAHSAGGAHRITQQLLSPVFSRFLWPWEFGSGSVSLATKCITVVLPKGSFNAPNVTFPCRNRPW